MIGEYFDNVRADYFRETIHCDGEIDPKDYTSFDVYKEHVIEWIMLNADFELESELYKQLMNRDLKEEQFSIFMNTMIEHNSFEDELRYAYKHVHGTYE